ncbi:MAG TPA: cellulase family glycosylhydrolase [Rhodopila sp.]|uniref:glycoside hydrolase family 5 protein n=1 Tax=Rhodopila sp. TaxID=2480087 RepID=UPI002B79C7C2|nr:cellulase family glycosylhydrolase [Rhodopila sp.]HVY16131.1 cellulase family glycosylhydrolase [Rhodopila sp.]
MIGWFVLTAAAARAQTLLPDGALSTQGSQIIDHDGRAVRLACIGWNQVNRAIPLAEQTRLMAANGFNCIRFPWVNATLEHDLPVMDSIVAAAKSAGLRVVFDNHTNEPGHGERDNWGAQQKNGLWFDLGEGSNDTDGGGNPGTTTNAKFLADWQTVARHFAGDQTVIGYDLRNEPLNYPGMSEWGTGSPRDIRLMYMRVGAAIQAIDPDKLIIVEPPSGDCRVVRTQPVTLPVAHKLVYSVHEYPTEISAEKVDSGPDLVRRMTERWGWLINEDIAPVFIGEMGSSMRSRGSRAWADTLVPYLNGKGLTIPEGGQGVSTDWWAWGYLPGQNPDGTLEKDWKTPRPRQLAVYARLRQKPLPAR